MTKFVKDRWYKLNDPKPFYMKFSHWEKENKDIRCSTYIINGYPYDNYQNNSITNNHWFIAKEVSFEEVSKYLPEGHPDRKSIIKPNNNHEEALIKLLKQIN